MMWIYFLLFFVSVNSKYGNPSYVPENITSPNPCADHNHIFLAPGVLTAGGSNRACVSRFHPEGPARLVLSLLTSDQKTTTVTRELPSGDGGCVDITAPQLPNTKAELIVNLRYPEAQCTWERRMSLRIASGRVVVVHTERARYGPGDIVRIRALVLKADLVPSHGVIDELWLEGPPGAWEGAHAAQWQRVRTRLGVAQVQHSLDPLAPPGRWAVRARLSDGSQGSVAFSVGNYELPPFQLSVRHAARVLRTSERLVWTVCVRYPWTEAVEGMLVIRIRGAGGAGGASGDVSAGIRTAVRLRAPRACHRHAAASRRIGLAGMNPPDVVLADFSFQEEGTRIWQNTTVVSQVVDKPITLEFLTKHRAVISLGLPYKLKVKATRWDEKPASNERVKVCRFPANHPSDLTQPSASSFTINACNDAVTDESGVARVMFTADDDGSPFYRFEATLKNDTAAIAHHLFLSVQRKGTHHAALGPLRADSNAARTFVPLYLNSRNVSHAITVHFVVITRGGIIYRWGATTQCPFANAANQIQTTARNAPCYNANLAKYDANYKLDTGKLEDVGISLDTNVANVNASMKIDANASDALLDRHMLRVMLPIKVTHQMCPESHLVAFFYLNGELVSASKHFEMEECFGNKVEATWESRQTLPGSTIKLHLNTPGPALCALTALDSAAKWVAPAPTIKEYLMGGLRKLIDSHRNLTEYDAAGECFFTADTPDLPTTALELTSYWLASAGVRVMGGDMKQRRCQSSAPAPLFADDITVPRSDFSEAWLWRLVAVGANGTGITSARAPDSITRYEATAVCVARTGLAMSSPAVLQVFREFFIHADGPKRLRHGDATIIRYRLFNYLYEPLSVQIQILTDPHLEGPSDYVESACVGARSSVARRVEVRAKYPGNARVSIRAKSVRDGSCVNVTISKTAVSDEVIVQMVVDPEGVPVQEHKSMLLCGKDGVESSSSEVTWNWPPVQAVPGTETLTVWTVADVTGPLLADADDLVLLPRGCGEQNMARLATNLLALQQLDPRSTAAFMAKEHVARGFTRQLQYVHPSGGFSAFGASDDTPSTWLTAFAVRYLRRAFQILSPGLPAPPALERAEQWLLSQQMENGCFRNEGQVFHRELRGALNEEGEIASVALTAYVITSLVESSLPLPSRIVRNTLSCLRALPLKSKAPNKVYAHSLLAYAFMRLKRYEEEVKSSNEAIPWKRGGEVAGLERGEETREMAQLLKLAKKNGDFIWWDTGSLSTSIEATSYAFLATWFLSSCPLQPHDTSCVHDSRAIIGWLSTHRNSAGGFVSTQDTLVALEALSTWSSLQQSAPINLNVTVRSISTVKTVNVVSEEKVPNVMRMGVGGKLTVNVEGTGCALVQATRSYNSHSSDEGQHHLLGVQVTVHTDGSFNCDVNGTNCFCAAVVEACVVWSGTFPEMVLLEVSLPGGYGADASLLYSQLQKSNKNLLRRIELSPTSSRATLYLGTRDGSDTLGRGGHQCYHVHAVGPKVKTKPSYVKVMDYYRPAVNSTQMYTIPEECPPRISHETNQYLASDNLYIKAKSLADSSEVLITNEYSFEDIPDGIPLEDPLYDNLKEQQGIRNNNNQIQNLVAKKVNLNYVNAVIDDKLDFKTVKPVENFNETVEPVITATIGAINNSEDKTYNVVCESIANKENNTRERKGKANLELTIRENEITQKTNEINKAESNIVIATANEIPKTETIHNKIQPTAGLDQDMETGDELKSVPEVTSNIYDKEVNRNKDTVENPNLSSFHVIDTEKDLDVPTGIEGPVPAVVLPPPNSRAYVVPYTGHPYHPYGYPRNPPPVNYLRMYKAFHPQRYYHQPMYQDPYRDVKFRRYNTPYG